MFHIFLCHLFAFCYNFSTRIGNALLFPTFFHIKLLQIFLESAAPASIMTCTESWQLLPNIYCKKCECGLWKYYALLLFIFLQKKSYKAFRRIIHPKIKSMPIFKWHWDKEEKMLQKLSQQLTKTS